MTEFKPIYLSIKESAKYTGLSEYYLRGQLKSGKIPHINSGNKIFIHIPSLLVELEKSMSSNAVSQ